MRNTETEQFWGLQGWEVEGEEDSSCHGSFKKAPVP